MKLLTAGLTLLLACGGGDPPAGDDAPDAPDARGPDAAADQVSSAIGPAGGTLEVGGATITVPAGALDEEVTLTLAIAGALTAPLPDGLAAVTPQVWLTPHGQIFALPVTVELPLDDAPAGTAFAWYLDDEEDTEWAPLAAAVVDDDVLRYQTTHFSGQGGADCGQGGACPAPTETICDDGIDNDGVGGIDCLDTDCAGSCGSLTVPFEITQDGAPATCNDVAGDVVSWVADGPNATLLAGSIACAAGEVEIAPAPQGAYQVSMTLVSVGQTELATTGPIPATVVATQSSTGATHTFAVSTSSCADVVISRIYTTGGLATDAYSYDFVELHNRTASPIPLDGRALHIRTDVGVPWTVADLTGETIPASGFLLIRAGRTFETDGVALPTPDVVMPHAPPGAPAPDLDGVSTVIALRTTTTPEPEGGCPTAGVIDLFGTMGSGCVEGQGFYGGPGTTEAIARAGCVDTDVNASDFTPQTVGAVRNSGSAPLACGACP
jgi:hypothetical protein